MIKIDKIFGDKKSGAVIYILLAIGILLLISGNLFKGTPMPETPVTRDSRAAQAENILSEIKGVGNVRVMVSEEEDSPESFLTQEKGNSTFSGGSVLIVADGGADSRVREKIIRAASAALGVDPHKIVVFERKE